MKNDIEYKRLINGKTVWITLSKQMVDDPKTGQSTEKGIFAAFRIDKEPRMIDGEYIKENGELKLFKDNAEAICAVHAAVEEKLRSFIPN